MPALARRLNRDSSGTEKKYGSPKDGAQHDVPLVPLFSHAYIAMSDRCVR